MTNGQVLTRNSKDSLLQFANLSYCIQQPPIVVIRLQARIHYTGNTIKVNPIYSSRYSIQLNITNMIQTIAKVNTHIRLYVINEILKVWVVPILDNEFLQLLTNKFLRL